MTVQEGTATRLRRLLAIVTWLAQVGEAPIAVAAERFGLTPDVLVTELEMAACCGLPPYTPDQLTDIIVTDTTVSARVGDALARPRRLTASEGFALAAAARAVLAVDGSDPGGALSRALSRLEAALGTRAVDVVLDEPPMLAAVRSAVASSSGLEIDYYSAAADRASVRVVAPARVFASEGHWYVDAYCSTAGDTRRFRIDRIRSARPVARPEGAPPGAGPPSRGFEPFVPGPEARRVRLSVDPSSPFAETVLALGEEVPSTGRPEVVVAVGGDAWLARLLLRAGDAVRVVDPPDLAVVGRDAAARILDRYLGSASKEASKS